MPLGYFIADILIVAAIFLWSDVIGPEETPAIQPPGKGGLSTSNKTPRNSGKLPLRDLHASDVALIDRDLFLSSFQRQAQVELLSCLRHWRQSPAELAVSGTLFKKTGRLNHLKASDTSLELPKCAVTAVDNMLFDNITPAMNRETIDLQWRIDW